MALNAAEVITAAESLNTALAPGSVVEASVADIASVRDNLDAVHATLTEAQKATLDQLSARVHARLSTRMGLLSLRTDLTPEQRTEATNLQTLSHALGRHGRGMASTLTGNTTIDAVPTAISTAYNFVEGQIGRVAPEHAGLITKAIAAIGSLWIVKKIVGAGQRVREVAGQASGWLSHLAAAAAGAFGFHMLTNNSVTAGILGPSATVTGLPNGNVPLAVAHNITVGTTAMPVQFDANSLTVNGKTFSLTHRAIPPGERAAFVAGGTLSAQVDTPTVTGVTWNGSQLNVTYAFNHQPPPPPPAPAAAPVAGTHTDTLTQAQTAALFNGLNGHAGAAGTALDLSNFRLTRA